MAKIRVISDLPVMDDSGNLLHVQELAGSSSETKPTAGMANGSLFLETDTGLISVFDEDDGWGTAQ
jgi:hypothetical protein